MDSLKSIIINKPYFIVTSNGEGHFSLAGLEPEWIYEIEGNWFSMQCAHGCKYCYATFMKRFTKHTEPWGTFLDVKNWQPIRNPKKYKGESVIIGSVTDAYHPLKEKYKRTRLFL